MKFANFESRKAVIALCFLAGAMNLMLMPMPAFSQNSVSAGDQARFPAQVPFQLAQYRECSQRIGPFATQSTAWQRWREAQSRGFSVSNGVVPCYDGDSRGYCFVAFFRC